MLGLRPDAQVAMLLGIGVDAVRHRRHQLRISLPGRERTFAAPKPWRAEDDALLGTVSDQEVARRLGRTTSCVKARRVRLGIASSYRRRPPAEDGELGNVPDETPAQRLRRTVKAVQARREQLGIPVPKPK